ncbi:MAG: sulfatase-like hydrolase/transferase [Myxococcales bacterium]|nr:sulfatase-like hydrolase/transferase [Myxococcales bacterium]
MSSEKTPRSRQRFVVPALGVLALAALGRCAWPRASQEQAASAPAPSASTVARDTPAENAAAVVEPAQAKPEPQRPYSVLFLMIDSLRADMPWAGYPRDIAPWLTKFAERATLYPRGYSLSSYTAKSVVPTFVGKYPSELKRDGWFFTHWFDDNVFLSERAQKHGVRTLAGNGHGYFLPKYGLNQGWDDYQLLEGTAIDFTGVADVTSDRLNELAKKMLSDPKNVDPTGKKPFFAYFHFLDPHYTYVKHASEPDWGNKRRDLYDNEVHFTDRWVGDLVDWALEQPWGKQLAVVITADHGEGFGERNHYRHAYEVWEALVRVPIFIYVPGAPPRRIDTPRGAIDLAPTMADLLGLPANDEYRGQSLVPEVFGAEAGPRPVITEMPRCDLMDRRRALIDGDYKLIAFGDDWRFKLFNVREDFAEVRDLSQKEPEKLQAMKQLYKELSAKIETVPVVGDAPLLGAPPHQRY